MPLRVTWVASVTRIQLATRFVSASTVVLGTYCVCESPPVTDFHSGSPSSPWMYRRRQRVSVGSECHAFLCQSSTRKTICGRATDRLISLPVLSAVDTHEHAHKCRPTEGFACRTLQHPLVSTCRCQAATVAPTSPHQVRADRYWQRWLIAHINY